MSFSFTKAAKGLVAGGIAVMIAANGFAATQGTTGATSEGTLDITLNVLDEVRISNLTDITLGDFVGADLTGSSDACIYRSGTGLYQITAEGSGAANAFELSDGGTNTVEYTVSFQEVGAATSTDLTSGTPVSGTAGDPASETCANPDPDPTAGPLNTATISVTVAQGDLAALPAASYSGTLTLSVAPE